MAQTPEGRVKDSVKQILNLFGCWYHMPVQNGMGKDTVDFHGARRVDGRAFIVETKAPGKSPSERQKKRIREALERNVVAFVLDGALGDMALFQLWISSPGSEMAQRAEALIHKWNLEESEVLDG